MTCRKGSYPTFLAHARPLDVPRGPTQAAHLEGEKRGGSHIYDAQLPAVPQDPIREKMFPQFLGWVASRVTGVLRPQGTGILPHANILGDYLPLRAHLPTHGGGQPCPPTLATATATCPASGRGGM